MLCGLLEPTSGVIELGGAGGNLRTEAVRKRIGYLSQKFSLYEDLTIRENLDFFSGVYGVPDKDREEKIRWVLSFSGLNGKENQITGSLPGGWKQRVAFGAAVMHEPDILFLDEPTSGVDPLARRAFWTMINRLADGGAAILVTTHYLEEAEQCNRLGMMVAGELVAEGTPSGIKCQQTGHVLEFILNQQQDQPQRAADLLKSKTENWRVSLFGERLHMITDDDQSTQSRKLRSGSKRTGFKLPAQEKPPSRLKTCLSPSWRRRARKARRRRMTKKGKHEANHCTNAQGANPDCSRLAHASSCAGTSHVPACLDELGTLPYGERTSHCRAGF